MNDEAFDAVEYWIERQCEGDRSDNILYTQHQQRLHRGFKRAILFAVLGENSWIETVADLGAGSGRITQNLPFHVEVDCLDVSPEAVARMMRRGQARIGTAADLEDVGLVVAYDVLYHIVDDDEFDRAVASIRSHCQLLLVSDGFACLECIEGDYHPGPHCRHRTLDRYAGFIELRSWHFPSKLPDLETNRIKLLEPVVKSTGEDPEAKSSG